MEETIEQVKDKQAIDLLFVAINDLVRYQSAGPVVANVNSIAEAMVMEYVEKYPEQKDYQVPKKSVTKE